MNSPIPPGSPYIPPFSQGEIGQSSAAAIAAATAGGGGKGIENLDVRKFYDEVMKIASQFSQTAPVAGGNPLVDRLGAPRIDAHTENFSVNDMTDLLRNMRAKSQDGQLRAAKEGIEAAKIKAEANNNAQLEKVKEWIKKCEEAQSKGLLGKIFGWIGKIFDALAAAVMVVVAAVATVVTSGAAAPLLAIAVVGAISATLTLASAISQEAGGPAISIDSLIQYTLGKFLTDVCGVDPKVAENICKIVGGVVGMVSLAVVIEPSLVGNMVQGIAVLAGADEQTAGYIGMACTIAATIGVGIALAVASCGTSTIGTVADVSTKLVVETMKAVNSAVMASSAIVACSTQIASGGLAISKAVNEEEAQQAIADKKELAAEMIKLQKMMEEGREEMKKIIQQIEESTQLVSKMIAGAAESMSQITTNMGGKSTV